MLNVEKAFLVIGLIALASMIVVLDYMRTRFGLKPEEYSEEETKYDEQKETIST